MAAISGSWSRTGEVIVNDVLVDPANPDHVLVATDRGGVLASNDGFAHYDASNRGFAHRVIGGVVVDNKDPNRIYVGVVNDKDLRRLLRLRRWRRQAGGSPTRPGRARHSEPAAGGRWRDVRRHQSWHLLLASLNERMAAGHDDSRPAAANGRKSRNVRPKPPASPAKSQDGSASEPIRWWRTRPLPRRTAIPLWTRRRVSARYRDNRQDLVRGHQ